MLKLTGNLIAKSLIKEGEGEYGKWQLIQFIISKQHQKKKKKIVFTAIGKISKKITEIKLKDRIVVYFFPECKEYNGKFYTELKVYDVEIYVSKKKMYEYIGNKSSLDGFNNFDNQLIIKE